MKTSTKTRAAVKPAAKKAAPGRATASMAKHKAAGKSNGAKAAAPAKNREDNNKESHLKKLFEDELKDIYWAEKALTKALPKMIKNATSKQLATALSRHLDDTEKQATRLEEVFDIMGQKVQGKKCEAMAGLIKEADELMKECDKGAMRDAAIILAAQKVEHYEIATYGTLRVFAKSMGYDDAAGILSGILQEEKAADVILTQIAEGGVNAKAESETE